MAEQLALTGGAMHASTVSEALTPDVEKILLDSASAEESTERLLTNPSMMDHLMECAGLVDLLSRPTDPQRVYELFAPLFLIFGAQDFGTQSESERLEDAWWQEFVKVMSPLPEEAIQIAVSEWIRVGKPFFPKPTEIYSYADQAAGEIRLLNYRVKAAVKAKLTQPKPKTEQDVEAVKAMLESLRGPNGRLQLAKPIPPPTPAGSQHVVADALRRMADR